MLTPAYDICPQGRTGNEATQAMLISGDNRMSTLKSCIGAAANFLLSEVEAVSIIEDQIATIANEWDRVCEEARLTETDERLFAGRQFLNAYCVDGLEESHAGLAETFIHARTRIAST